MKSFLCKTTSSASTGDKIKISKQELERMVELEVQSSQQKREIHLDALINAIQQQLDEGMSSESTMKKLKSRMIAVIEKATKVVAHFNEARTLPPNPSPSTCQIATPSFQTPTPPVFEGTVGSPHLELKNVRTLSESSLKVEGSSVSEFMEDTKKQFQLLHAQNEALKAAVEDIRERTTPSPTTAAEPRKVLEGLAKLMHIKKEPVDSEETAYCPVTAPLKRPKEEYMPPEAEQTVKRIKTEPGRSQYTVTQNALPYPALPQFPLPTHLPAEAARYNLPSRVKVDLALIKNPSPQLSVVWTLEDHDPKEPPLDTYSVLFTSDQGTGIFDEWQILGEHKVSGDSMFAFVPLSRSIHRVCVAVVGKDQFGRYGPFSKVTCACAYT